MDYTLVAHTPQKAAHCVVNREGSSSNFFSHLDATLCRLIDIEEKLIGRSKRAIWGFLECLVCARAGTSHGKVPFLYVLFNTASCLISKYFFDTSGSDGWLARSMIVEVRWEYT